MSVKEMFTITNNCGNGETAAVIVEAGAGNWIFEIIINIYIFLVQIKTFLLG